MAQGDNNTPVLLGTDAVLATALTALNTAISTARAAAYGNKLIVIQSGLYSNYDNTGAPTLYVAWATVQYLTA